MLRAMGARNDRCAFARARRTNVSASSAHRLSPVLMADCVIVLEDESMTLHAICRVNENELFKRFKLT